MNHPLYISTIIENREIYIPGDIDDSPWLAQNLGILVTETIKDRFVKLFLYSKHRFLIRLYLLGEATTKYKGEMHPTSNVAVPWNFSLDSPSTAVTTLTNIFSTSNVAVPWNFSLDSSSTAVTTLTNFSTSTASDLLNTRESTFYFSYWKIQQPPRILLKSKRSHSSIQSTLNICPQEDVNVLGLVKFKRSLNPPLKTDRVKLINDLISNWSFGSKKLSKMKWNQTSVDFIVYLYIYIKQKLSPSLCDLYTDGFSFHIFCYICL